MSKQDHSTDAANYVGGVNAGDVRRLVRKAITEKISFHPDKLVPEWRRRFAELTRVCQRERGLVYEHAEAQAFEQVLCDMWHTGKTTL